MSNRTRKSPKTSHFIHFGCWNRGGCDLNANEPNSLTRVMRTLRRSKPEFITICGDNYYPDKVEGEKKDKKEKEKEKEKDDKKEKKEKKEKKDKVKLLNTAELQSGFDCLPTNTQIYMSYGNHDLETGLNVDGETEKEKECRLASIEKSIAQRKNINLHLFQHVWFGRNLVIMLETSLYDEITSELEKCYSVVDPDIDSANKMHEKQMDFVRSLAPDIARAENIIIIGHHPLSYLKYKNEAVKRVTLDDKMFDILQEIHANSNPMSSFYYLCADYHQYTEGTVIVEDHPSRLSGVRGGGMTIHQYIVGTGGAKLDNTDLEEYRNNKETVNDADESRYRIRYIMTETNIANTAVDNGYLVVKRTGDKIQCNFVTAMKTSSNIKSRKKTIRRSQK